LISDDGFAGPALDGIGGIAVVANEPAGARRDIGTRRSDQRIEVRAAWLEAFQPAARQPRLETANESPKTAPESCQ
jgi:hypothetical protein